MILNNYILTIKISTDEYLIINPLHGTAIKGDNELVQTLKEKRIDKIPKNIKQTLLSTGILVTSEKEIREILKDIVKRDKLPPAKSISFDSFTFIVTWSCNFACKYCFENKSKRQLFGKMNLNMITAAFEFIDKYSDNSSEIFINLTGGEPLLLSNFPEVSMIFKMSQERNSRIGITTNGFNLVYYKDLILKYSSIIDLIRVTIDGPEPIHNRRRPLWGGHETFSQITGGIQELIDLGLGNKIQIVTKFDSENIKYLPEYIDFLKRKEWLGKLKIALGVVGNYGNYTSTKENELSQSRRIISEIIDYLERNPELIPLINFSDESGATLIAKEIFIERKLPKPKARACGGIRVNGRATFSPDGKIYSCTMFAEAQMFPIGSYYPNQRIFPDNIEALRDRTILSLRQCQKCPLLPICAGGCPFRQLSREQFLELKLGKKSLSECTTCVNSKLLEEDLGMFFSTLKPKEKEVNI